MYRGATPGESGPVVHPQEMSLVSFLFTWPGFPLCSAAAGVLVPEVFYSPETVSRMFFLSPFMRRNASPKITLAAFRLKIEKVLPEDSRFLPPPFQCRAPAFPSRRPSFDVMRTCPFNPFQSLFVCPFLGRRSSPPFSSSEDFDSPKPSLFFFSCNMTRQAPTESDLLTLVGLPLHSPRPGISGWAPCF